MQIENAKITILVNSNQTTIEIKDANANTKIVSVTLTPEQLSMALSRLAYVDCKCETGDLSKIGKKHENQKFEFKTINQRDPEKLAIDCANALAERNMTEWKSDNNYNLQNSFFYKDDVTYARVTIRRWV